MDKKTRKKWNLFNENIDIFILFLLMIIIPITTIIDSYNPHFIDYNKINNIVIIILIYSLIYKLIKSKFKIYIYDIFVFILLLLNVLSTIFSIDKEVAIYGAYRFNGLITLIMYDLIILNLIRLKDKVKIKFLIITLVIVGIINVIISCIQIFCPIPDVFKFVFPHMASGLCFNPNFFGSFMSMLLAFMVTLFIFNNKNQIIYFILSILFLIGLYFSHSTGPVVGVIIAVLFLFILILITNRKYIKRYFLIVLVLIVSFIGINKCSLLYYEYKDYELDKRVMMVEGLKEVYEILGSILFKKDYVINESTGTGRIGTWKNTIPILKRYPLLGCGTDNFYLAYGEHADSVITTDAHNVYLNYAANNGIPAALIFIFALLYLLYEAIKTKDKIILALSIGYVAYCVQAFFNVSVIQVSTYFYIFTGLLIACINIYKKSNYN